MQLNADLIRGQYDRQSFGLVRASNILQPYNPYAWNLLI